MFATNQKTGFLFSLLLPKKGRKSAFVPKRIRRAEYPNASRDYALKHPFAKTAPISQLIKSSSTTFFANGGKATRLLANLFCRPLQSAPTFLGLLGVVGASILGLPHSGKSSELVRHAAEAPPARKVNIKRLTLVGLTWATAGYIGYRYVEEPWYLGQKSDRIRWANDWSGETYLNLDKGGHFSTGIGLAETMTSAYEWSGLRPRSAVILGALSSWLSLLAVEWHDAHFYNWGFSIPDFAANTLGVSVPLMHHFYPGTQALRFKFSYFPSPLYRERDERERLSSIPDGPPFFRHMIDDYQGMTFWMTLAVNELLPREAEKLWPDYLGLALGVGGRGLHGSNAKSRGPNKKYGNLPDGQNEIILALDYDARRLPSGGATWKFIKKRLIWFHFPAPAVRLYPEWGIYLFYF